jgi:hypothetical protein
MFKTIIGYNFTVNEVIFNKRMNILNELYERVKNGYTFIDFTSNSINEYNSVTLTKKQKYIDETSNFFLELGYKIHHTKDPYTLYKIEFC